MPYAWFDTVERKAGTDTYETRMDRVHKITAVRMQQDRLDRAIDQACNMNYITRWEGFKLTLEELRRIIPLLEDLVE
jgi:hypothetical protein